jgi:hypothetical protein
MHHLVRLTIATIISGIVGRLAIAIINSIYSLIISAPPTTNSDFTIINWTISLIVSGVVFVLVYIKVTSWLEG